MKQPTASRVNFFLLCGLAVLLFTAGSYFLFQGYQEVQAVSQAVILQGQVGDREDIAGVLSIHEVYYNMRFAYQKILYGTLWFGSGFLIATILTFTHALRTLRKKVDAQEQEIKSLRSLSSGVN